MERGGFRERLPDIRFLKEGGVLRSLSLSFCVCLELKDWAFKWRIWQGMASPLLSKSSRGTAQKKLQLAACKASGRFEEVGDRSTPWESHPGPGLPAGGRSPRCTGCRPKPGPGPNAAWLRERSATTSSLGALLCSLDWAGGDHSWYRAHISQLAFTEPHSKCCIPGLKTANIRRESSLGKRNTFFRTKRRRRRKRRRRKTMLPWLQTDRSEMELIYTFRA